MDKKAKCKKHWQIRKQTAKNKKEWMNKMNKKGKCKKY